MANVTIPSVDALVTSVGVQLGHTEWLEITQARIDAFAEVTGDHQWIHVDPARAAASPFGGTIAHGYLTLSLCNLFLPQLLRVDGASMGINYGSDRIRFPAPVPSGSRIRGTGEIVGCTEVAGGVQATIRVTVEVDGQDRPGCVADTLNRWLR